jgi:PHD/YefM family antitoxin component YafN of YafNO toxin-antitoxin module
MTTLNATNFRNNFFSYMEQVVKYCEPLNITTKHGNVVVLNEDDYKSLLETMYIESIPHLADSIIASVKSAENGETVEMGGMSLTEFAQNV